MFLNYLILKNAKDSRDNQEQLSLYAILISGLTLNLDKQYEEDRNFFQISC